MPAVDWRLWLGLGVGTAAVQALAWLLARGLRLRLSRAAVLGGLLLPLLLLAPWLDGEPLLVPCNLMSGHFPGVPKLAHPDPHELLNDVIYQFIPWELEVRHALSAGRLPFWSDLLEGGSSPWANPQAAVLSPLATLARIVPIQHHLLAMLAFKVLIAFEGTWLLARRLGRSRPASLLAAGGFALGGALLPWSLYPHSAAAAWVPWLVAGTVGLFRRPDGRLLATTAAIAAAVLLSGHPETAAVAALFAGLCGFCFRRRRPGLPRGLAAAALAAALGFGLAAPHLVPFLRILPGSQRAQEMLAQEPVAHPVRLADSRTWFELGRWPFMLSPVSPHAFGRPYRDPFRGAVNWTDSGSGYAGLVAFAGALVALLAARDRKVWPLAGFALLAMLLPARFVPLSQLLHLVPFLRVPAYARFLLVGCLALVLAGAFGIDRLLGYRTGQRRGRQPDGEPDLLSRRPDEKPDQPGHHRPDEPPDLLSRRPDEHPDLLSARANEQAEPPARLDHRPAGRPGASAAARPRPGPTVWISLALAVVLSLAVAADGHVLLVWGLIAAGALAAALLPARRRPLAAALLGLALLADLVPWGRSHLPSGHPALFYPRTQFLADLEQLVGDPAAFRAVGAEFLVYPGLLAVYGQADPRPHNPLAPMAYLRVLRGAFDFAPTAQDYFARFGNVDHPLLDFLGVRGVVASVAMPPSRTLELADGGRYAPFYLFRNPDPLPRWFQPAAADVIAGREIEGWIARLDRPGRVSLFREEVGPWTPAGLDGRVHPLRVLAAEPGRVALAVPPRPAETLIASSVLYSPGWRATAAGRRVSTVQVHGAFLGVRVPPGAERVDLRFRPPGLLPGLAACLLAILTCATLLLRSLGLRQRRGLWGGGRVRLGSPS